MKSLNKRYAKLTPKQFEAWYNKYCKGDNKTWEEWYVEIGGKLPKKKE